MSQRARGAALAAACLFLGFGVVACDALLGIEELSTPGGGTGGGDTCTPPSVDTCPPPPGGSACLAAACTTNGQCALVVAPVGTPVTSQIEGDCQAVVCQADGSAAATLDKNDTPNDGNECTTEACGDDAVPSQSNVAEGTPCAAGVCDGQGACVECTQKSDCPGTEVCKNNECVPPGCVDMVQNGQETDVDCGGPVCDACADGLNCDAPSDCVSGVCETEGNNKVCKAPTCLDDVQNGAETDVDCGGGTCDPCPDGDKCKMPSDCESAVCSCTGQDCTPICQQPSCDDGVQNGNEVEPDCGPDCQFTCGTGDPCEANDWCVSKVCEQNLCIEASCTDGVKNQDEEGVDCGGATCDSCGG